MEMHFKQVLLTWHFFSPLLKCMLKESFTINILCTFCKVLKNQELFLERLTPIWQTITAYITLRCIKYLASVRARKHVLTHS